MKAQYIKDDDALILRFSESRIIAGQDLDDARHIDYAADNSVVRIKFLDVSQLGINLTGIPEHQRALITLWISTLDGGGAKIGLPHS